MIFTLRCQWWHKIKEFVYMFVVFVKREYMLIEVIFFLCEIVCLSHKFFDPFYFSVYSYDNMVTYICDQIGIMDEQSVLYGYIISCLK